MLSKAPVAARQRGPCVFMGVGNACQAGSKGAPAPFSAKHPRLKDHLQKHCIAGTDPLNYGKPKSGLLSRIAFLCIRFHT